MKNHSTNLHKKSQGDKLLTVVGTCIHKTEKSITFKSEHGNRANFPLSQITVLSGTLAAGEAVTLAVPKWLIDKARKENTPITTTGTCIGMRDKAVKVLRDADNVECWLAYSVCEIKGEVIQGEPVEAVAPAYALKLSNGRYPKWVWEALQ